MFTQQLHQNMKQCFNLLAGNVERIHVHANSRNRRKGTRIPQIKTDSDKDVINIYYSIDFTEIIVQP